MEVSLRVFSGNIYHLDVPDFIDVASGCPSALSLSGNSCKVPLFTPRFC